VLLLLLLMLLLLLVMQSASSCHNIPARRLKRLLHDDDNLQVNEWNEMKWRENE